MKNPNLKLAGSQTPAHRATPSLRWKSRRWLAPLGVLLSLGLLVAILIYSQYTNFQRSSPNPSLEGKSDQLSQTTQSNAGAPKTQAELANRRDIGPLQQNVAANQATVFFDLGTGTEIPAFDKSELSVRRGQVISLTLTNHSEPQFHYQDSWVLVRPNRAGEAAVAASEAGSQENWIPHNRDVLANTRMLKSGESQTIIFKAPSEPGDYPFMSTFPGHSQAMKGVLHVR